MFPPGLSEVCAIVGVAMLTLAFGLLRYYKERTKKIVSDEISRLLLTKEISDFTKKIKAKDLTFEMVSDFYTQFVDANEPNVRLKNGWLSLIASGILFIAAAIAGNIEFAYLEILGYQAIGLGFLFMIVSFLNIGKLESKF